MAFERLGSHQRQTGHLAQRQGRRRRIFLQARLPGLNQHQFLHEQRAAFEFGHQCGVIQDREVESSLDQSFLQGGRQALTDRQLRLGQLAAEGARQRNGQDTSQRRRQADRDAARRRAAQEPEVLACALDLMQDAAAVVEQDLAGLGRDRAATVAHQ